VDAKSGAIKARILTLPEGPNPLPLYRRGKFLSKLTFQSTTDDAPRLLKLEAGTDIVLAQKYAGDTRHASSPNSCKALH
jgi:hypothetical protein